MSSGTTPSWRRTGPPLVVARATERRGEPSVGEQVKAWRVEIDRRHIYLGEGRLLGWLHRARFYEQREGGRSAPYFIIEGAECSASHARDIRMPVVELTRPHPPGPPPEFPVYPRCPECGGELGLDDYEADAGLIRCYGFRQTCTACDGTGLWGEWEEEDRCPACGGSGHAPRSGCGSLFVDTRDGRAGPVPAFDAR